MKLPVMVDTPTVLALRGRVDFYYWKGIPVARSWPKKSSPYRTPGEILSSQKFVVMAKAPGMLPPYFREAWKTLYPGIGVTWVDAARASIAGKAWLKGVV